MEQGKHVPLLGGILAFVYACDSDPAAFFESIGEVKPWRPE